MHPLVASALVGSISAMLLTAGWYIRGLYEKNYRNQLVRTQVKYRVLEISYLDKLKIQEFHRFLWTQEFDTWSEAQADAKKKLDEDTLKNKFTNEYVVVEAP